MKRGLFCILACIIMALNTGCGSKLKDGDAVKANLSLENGTSSLRLNAVACHDMGGGFVPAQCFTPTGYGLKILSVYVSPDASGAISGAAGLIWANKDCPLQRSESEVDGKRFTYESVGDGCADDKVTGFFDLARSSADVNAELNSQDHAILPGTYNYVQMAFCIGGPKSKNARFKTSDMSDWFEVSSGACGISSAKADPPIVVGEGESVTVKLSYDLSNIIYQNGTASDSAGNSACYVDAGKTMARCFGFPHNLKPGFAKR